MAHYPENLGYLEHLHPDVLKAIDGTSQMAQGLERQDLEGELTRLNILETPFYERLDKVTATALEHEYSLVTSRHDKIGYAAYKDGGVPRTIDADVVRRRTRPTLIGHRITITELAQATTREGIQTAEQTARNEKMVAVMEETEWMNFHGNRAFGSTDFSSPSNLQYDGIPNMTKRGAPQNILDLKGAPLSLAALWKAENLVYQTQGMARPTSVFMSPIDKINLQQSFYQVARTTQAERAAGVLGADAQSYISAFGESELVTSRFLGDWDKFSDLGVGNTGGEFARPAAPTLGVSEDNNATDGGLAEGAYTYVVKAANFYGESAATSEVTATVGSGENRVILAISSVDAATKWFIVFRRDGATGEMKFLKKVPHYSGATATIYDTGHETLVSAYGEFTFERIPGTGTVVGVDFRTTALASWIPLEQVRLPSVLNSDWVIRHVGSLYARAPEFNWAIVNVGQNSIV